MRSVLLSCIVAVAAAGCSGGPAAPQLVPVSGVLTVGGKPLPDVGVQLAPSNPMGASKDTKATFGASAMTDAAGKFTFKSLTGENGVVKGKYKVILVYTPKMDPKEMSGLAAQNVGRATPPPKIEYPFPKEYLTAETSPKEIEVTDKTPELKLDL